VKGFAIFYAAMWRIFNNFDVAFRVSIAWIAICALFGGALFAMIIYGSAAMLALWLLLPFFVVLFIGLSIIAIGWHRFCIFGEKPVGFYTWPQMGLLWEYVKAAIITILWAILLSIPFIFILMPLIGISLVVVENNAIFAILVAFAANVVLGAIIAGISLYLPAAAVGRPITFSEIRDVILGQFSVLLTLSFALFYLQFGSELLFENAGLARMPIGLHLDVVAIIIVQILVGWFLFMLSIGYISELYRTYFVDDDANEDVAASPQPGQ